MCTLSLCYSYGRQTCYLALNFLEAHCKYTNRISALRQERHLKTQCTDSYLDRLYKASGYDKIFFLFALRTYPVLKQEVLRRPNRLLFFDMTRRENIASNLCIRCHGNVFT
jgi:hypothetical protein